MPSVHDGYLPTSMCLAEGSRHDVSAPRVIQLSPGSIVALDRGYNGYGLFGCSSEAAVSFVTRLKAGAFYSLNTPQP